MWGAQARHVRNWNSEPCKGPESGDAAWSDPPSGASTGRLTHQRTLTGWLCGTRPRSSGRAVEFRPGCATPAPMLLPPTSPRPAARGPRRRFTGSAASRLRTAVPLGATEGRPVRAAHLKEQRAQDGTRLPSPTRDLRARLRRLAGSHTKSRSPLPLSAWLCLRPPVAGPGSRAAALPCAPPAGRGNGRSTQSPPSRSAAGVRAQVHGRCRGAPSSSLPARGPSRRRRHPSLRQRAPCARPCRLTLHPGRAEGGARRSARNAESA
ncbi:serine/arginine repetitive matrix protein 1-like [Pezoporus flaviventris]|uniref:serine/arginine repetitive matrix protein 1-like n=1 Tax=Pezoporus flaviventris TaxID=889875 RepID=UPI002AB14977|nr:serine/arginine repetitive matrix protein 1-like [Pezoporus flaviventris]